MLSARSGRLSKAAAEEEAVESEDDNSVSSCVPSLDSVDYKNTPTLPLDWECRPGGGKGFGSHTNITRGG